MNSKQRREMTVQPKDTYNPADYITVHQDYLNGLRQAIRRAHGDACICIYCGRRERPAHLNSEVRDG